jgi:hypothetical protein
MNLPKATIEESERAGDEEEDAYHRPLRLLLEIASSPWLRGEGVQTRGRGKHGDMTRRGGDTYIRVRSDGDVTSLSG